MWKDLDRLQERSQTVQAEGEEQRQGGVGDEEAGTDEREQGLPVGYAGENVSRPGLGHRAEGGCWWWCP